MELKELFDNPAPFSSFKREDNGIFSIFSVKDKDYLVYFHIDEPLDFFRNISANRVTFDLKSHEKIYSFAFGLITEDSGTTDIQSIIQNQKVTDMTTNTGDSFIVFSTVGHIVKKFFETYSPNYFYFGAQEDNRYTLYTLLAKKLIKIFPKYDFKEERHLYIVYKKALHENINLKELFDNPLPFKKESEELYTFEIEGVPPYQVHLVPFNNTTVADLLNDEYYIKMSSVKPVKGMSFSFTQGETFLQTNTGNAPKVFSTVASILKEYINTNKPDFFFFEATNAEESRVRLYEILSKRIVKEYPRYEFVQLNANVRESDMFLFYDPEIIRLKDNY